MSEIFESLLYCFWFPWFNFYFEIFCIQFFIFYFLFLFYSSANIYYTLLYFWILIVAMGLYLGLVQMELFLGFFWIVEFTVIFISLLLLFYLNVEGLVYNLTLKINMFFLFFIFWLNLFLFNFFNLSLTSEVSNQDWLVFDFVLDNFYDSIFNVVLNDFIVLFLAYYNFNSFEFLVMGLILFFGSIVCIFFNLFSKKINFSGDLTYLNKWNLNLNFLNFDFLRKQNLKKQSLFVHSIRVFKKKKINDTKRFVFSLFR